MSRRQKEFLEEINLSDESLELWNQLLELHYELRDYTSNTYDRINPFVENLFSWSEKGDFCGGNEVTIYDSAIISGDVEIGNYSWIGPFCSIDGTGGLTIGEYCSISSGTRILSHNTIKWAVSGGDAEYEYEPVTIGNRCFIGVNSVVLKGVSIGDQSVVAAGSIVSDDFDSKSIIAGNPAAKIGEVVVDEDIQLKFY